MKLVVLLDLPGGIVEIRGLIKHRKLALQRIARLRRQVFRGPHAGMTLHANPQVVDFVDVGGL